ncbi:MAG UNVERIFIED_CONTAM: HAMP domain-containing histidine kinase [Rickettsiaceae bacterium]|jgi:two-component system osmolarity sensor histidine kinase EnvZ
MKNRIENYIAGRTNTLAMISHDLKTPLTRMKLQLELMGDSEDINDMKKDVISMQQMIESYLDFARGEGGEKFVTTKILNWFKNSLNISSYNNLEINYSDKSENLEILIKPHSFKRAIDNILGNANKYASKVLVSIYEYKNNAVIEIEDNGEGIRDEMKNLVFKPFYRADTSRNIKFSGSVGLGLSITKEIILSHNGTIELLDSETLKGLKVKILLPLSDI